MRRERKSERVELWIQPSTSRFPTLISVTFATEYRLSDTQTFLDRKTEDRNFARYE
jgi:hypothetical protein